MPSSFVYTLPAFQETLSPTVILTADGFGRGLQGGLTSKSTAGSSSNSSDAVPAGVWFSTSYLINIQPMPTQSIFTSPLTKPIPSIIISNGKPESTKSAEGDGASDCKIFGCKPHCDLFACDGRCGIFGCSGGCGPLGCVGDCPLVKFRGLDCVTGCGSSGSENDCNDNDSDNENDNDDNDCDDPVTASACTTECEEIVPCTDKDTKTSTTATIHDPVTTALMTGFYDTNRMPMNTNYNATASSIIEYGLGYHGSLQSTTTTTVTASPTASISTFTSVVVVTPTPTPVAPRTVCFLHDDILWFEIQMITNSLEKDWAQP
ncbi:hypothetical protein BofuT4_P055550.1 [Botrytis cinerea T4]|uniref:Uncharacterized protein n=1 Tax=Botryotinia fuckeliana (strain T4) TaxID=999810 RepID=G2XVY4_BOTF4|nr:hypothetical protein BofuT4_P055550.1 [Botrytis cinerea T4]